MISKEWFRGPFYPFSILILQIPAQENREHLGTNQLTGVTLLPFTLTIYIRYNFTILFNVVHKSINLFLFVLVDIFSKKIVKYLNAKSNNNYFLLNEQMNGQFSPFNLTYKNQLKSILTFSYIKYYSLNIICVCVP